MERELNPSIREILAETAEIARDEETYWETRVAESLPLVWDHDHQGLDLVELRGMPRALQRRVIRATAEQYKFSLESKHVADILTVVHGESEAASLPRDWQAERERNYLRFIPPQPVVEQDYEYLLPVPGRVEAPEAAACFEASLVQRASEGYNPEELLNAEYAVRELRVRNWRAGDQFWPAHTKSPKKVKELLQERHITGTQRKLWPVVVSGDELLWLRGFVARKAPNTASGGAGLLIREIPLPKASR
jgi:tRNA(Ile)-lysidine synthase